MSPAPQRFVCDACGETTFLKRVPVYDGFKKTGETCRCAACGAAVESEAAIPALSPRPSVFTDEDRSPQLEVFADDENRRLCRYCDYYVVNPFTQRCDLRQQTVEATDTCDSFRARPAAASSDADESRVEPTPPVL